MNHPSIRQPTANSLAQAAAPAAEPKFSIFSSVITVERREFYERIVSELNGIFPICTQGNGTTAYVKINLMDRNRGIVAEGWYSFFTNADGIVIASGDPGIVEPGKTAYVPKKHHSAVAGKPPMSYGIFECRDSARGGREA